MYKKLYYLLFFYLDFEKVFVHIYCPMEEYLFTKNVNFFKVLLKN